MGVCTFQILPGQKDQHEKFHNSKVNPTVTPKKFNNLQTYYPPEDPRSPFYRIEESLNPIIRNYSTEEIKSLPQTWCSVQDKRGILYFGNNSGLLEYDGVTWRKIDIDNDLGCSSLRIDSHGKIFVGGHGDLGYLDINAEGKVHYKSLLKLVPKDKLDFTQVWKIIIVGDKYYFQSPEYIFIWDGKSTQMKVLEGDLHTMVKCNDDIYVRDRTRGLLQIINNELREIDITKEFLTNPVYFVLPFGKDKKIIGTLDKGVLVYDGKKLEPLDASLNNYLMSCQIYSGNQMRNGYYGICTFNGGFIILDKEGRLMQTINQKTGLQSNEVNFFSEDDHGGIWLCLGNGISRLELYNGITVGCKEYCVNAFYSFEKTKCFASTKGVFELRPSIGLPGSSSVAPVRIGSLVDQCWDFLHYKNEILISSGSGVYRINLVQNTNEILIPNKVVYCLGSSELYPNLLFVGGEDGLTVYKFENGIWRFFSNIKGVQSPTRSIVIDKKGNIWVASYNEGLICVVIKDKRALNPFASIDYTLIKYSEQDTTFPKSDVNVLELDSKIRVLTEKGIYLADEQTMKVLPDTYYHRKLAGGEITVLKMTKSENGSYWCIGNDAKDISNTMVLTLYPDNNSTKKSYRLFTNLFSRVGNLSMYSILAESNGIVWLGHENGIVRLNSNTVRDYEQPFPALVRKVIVNNTNTIFYGAYQDHYQRVSLLQTPEYFSILDFKHNSLRFECASICFDASERNEYQFFLENYDEEWTPFSKESHKDYTQLSEGTYKFHVRAKNIYGTISREAVYEFKILPPWYRTYWAYAFFSITAISSIVLVFVWRIKAERKKLEKDKRILEQKVDERTAEVVKQAKELEEKNNEITQINEEIIQHRDEILAINDSIKKANDEITRQKEEIEHKSSEIHDSIVYARRIQDAILPQLEDIAATLPQSFVLYKPKDIVSGDFFWFTEVHEKAMIAAVDCTGHGIPGAFMSVLGSSLLNQIVNEKGLTDPGSILNALNELVQSNLHQSTSVSSSKDGMDLTLAVIDYPNKSIYFSGANNPLYFIRNGELLEYKTNKYPIGGGQYEGRNFETQKIEFIPGDVLYLFSDGYADQFGGPNRKKFMYGKFKKLLIEIYKEPMSDQKSILDRIIEEWRAESNMDQIDDILVIGVGF